MSVLVIAPHMDDEVLGCGGVLQRANSAEVLFCTTLDTDERLGADGERHPYEGTLRQKEMENVAEVLGFKFELLPFDTHRLDRVSRAVLLKHLDAHVKGAELLFVPGPSHDQDHQAVSRTVEALMRPHCFAGSVLEYWTWGSPSPYEPQVVVPLTEEEVGIKLSALAKYKTQLEPGSRLYPYSVESVSAYMQANGRLAGENYAEVFTPRRLVPNRTTARFFDA
jgi:LmbE family N-acetylglucosaminyl deacetylase